MSVTRLPQRPLPSERLLEAVQEMLEGRAPNTGRFCGGCYHPLRQGEAVCPHCGLATAERPPAERLPLELLAMVEAQRFREGLVVRTLAYAGLVAGIVLSLLPIALFDVHWWTVLGLFGILAFSYVFFANLANTVGDALGYRWGQSVLRRRWERFLAQRERP